MLLLISLLSLSAKTHLVSLPGFFTDRFVLQYQGHGDQWLPLDADPSQNRERRATPRTKRRNDHFRIQHDWVHCSSNRPCDEVTGWEHVSPSYCRARALFLRLKGK